MPKAFENPKASTKPNVRPSIIMIFQRWETAERKPPGAHLGDAETAGEEVAPGEPLEDLEPFQGSPVQELDCSSESPTSRHSVAGLEAQLRTHSAVTCAQPQNNLFMEIA